MAVTSIPGVGIAVEDADALPQRCERRNKAHDGTGKAAVDAGP
jgi:hypothetical protein